MSFDIKILKVFKLGGIDVWLTETMISTWIIMGILIALAVAVRVMLKKFSDIPKGFQNVIETAVEFFDNFLRGSAGEKLIGLGSWFFTVIAFMILSNISGLFFLRPPTADWNVTVGFALVTFVLIQAMGVRYNGKEYVKSIFPNPFLALLNVIGELARPVSLSFRLFGNILGGMILLSLVYGVAPIFVKFLIPSVLHFYFDLFAGALQAYIFCVLSLSFIGVAAAQE